MFKLLSNLIGISFGAYLFLNVFGFVLDKVDNIQGVTDAALVQAGVVTYN